MPAKRLYFLDNLKWGVVYLMVIFHAAMCYMAYAPEWWYVVDGREPSWAATVFVCWADIFIMPVMFFVSGYFGLASLQRYDSRRFWRGKLTRIILPWLFGALFVAPWVTYIMLASRHSPVGFWEFYTTLFWGVLYQQAQYWYLGALTALYLILWVVCRLWPRLLDLGETKAPSALHLAGLCFLSVLSIGLIGSSMHPDTWTFYGYILVLQPVRIPSYILVFGAGALAYRQRWFAPGGYTPSPVKWGAAFLLWSALYLWQKLFLPASGAVAPTVVPWLNALCQGAFMWTATFFLLGFAKRFLDRTTPLLGELAATSYGVYYLHMPLLFPIAWLFVPFSIPLGIKYPLVCFLTLTGCWALAKYGLSRLTSFR